MVDLIELHRVDLVDLCRRHHVRTLEVFGSAASGAFDPNHSDVDFLVEFEPMAPSAHSRAYFGLWFALQDVFQRDVDLVEISALTNPFFLQSIRPSRRVLYAA